MAAEVHASVECPLCGQAIALNVKIWLQATPRRADVYVDAVVNRGPLLSHLAYAHPEES